MPAEPRTLQFYQADVFTDRPFGGNPVAVIPEAGGLSDGILQHIAREMNLSETVFVFPPTDANAVAKVRIFTPLQEIPFAGHPILGTFFVLGTLGRLPLHGAATRMLYECNLGSFPIEVHTEGKEIRQVVMTQPKPQFLGTIEDVKDLYEIAKALGLAKSQLMNSKFPLEIVSTGLPILIVPVRTLTAVRSIEPDIAGITEVCTRHGVNGLMTFTTMTVEEDSAVHTRMFAPLIGVVEDPATGSASGALGAYLVHHGVVEVFPATEIVSEQGYELERPSRILIRIESDDDAIQDVKVGGQAVMVIEGSLHF